MKTAEKTGQEQSEAERLVKSQIGQKRLERLIRFLNPQAADEIMRDLFPLYDLMVTKTYAARNEVFEPTLADAFRRATMRTPVTVTLVSLVRVLRNISDQQADLIWDRNRTGMRRSEGFPQLDGPLFRQARAAAQEIVGKKVWKCLRAVLKNSVFADCDGSIGVLKEALENVFEVAVCWTAFAVKGHVGMEAVNPLFRIVRRTPFVITYGNEWNATPLQQPVSLTVFIR